MAKGIFLESAINRFRSYKQLGDRTFSQLEDPDFDFIPAIESNSLAVIIQHMSGNMLSRWTNFLTEDGEKSWRRRDEEFEVRPQNKALLMEEWENGWNCMFNELENLTESDLAKTIFIRSEPHSVLDAINRQLTHYAYHVGQIVYLGKMIRGDQWKTLSIEKGKSGQFNQAAFTVRNIKK